MEIVTHMKILFLHGWHSIPGGVKPTYLKDHGNIVFNPALDDDDFLAALARAQAEYDQHRPDVIVGASRGGAIALNIASHSTPLLLLCPAWKNWGTANSLKPNSLILHSRQDDVIPFEDSEELLDNSSLSRERLIEVGTDHRLADSDSLAVMLWGCQMLVSGQDLQLLLNDEPSLRFSSDGHKAMLTEETSYICDACGEVIVIPFDATQGSSQTYVEDCPVCCRANTIHVRIEDGGQVHTWSEPEQDHDWTS